MQAFLKADRALRNTDTTEGRGSKHLELLCLDSNHLVSIQPEDPSLCFVVLLPFSYC